MNAVFADTAFYIAFCSVKDCWHDKARELAFLDMGKTYTTEFVLLELGNHLSAPEGRLSFLRMNTMIREDPGTVVIPASSDLIQNGLSLYADRLDKGWSLTDCISMAVMRGQGIALALTSDHHFEQAGFAVMLKR